MRPVSMQDIRDLIKSNGYIKESENLYSKQIEDVVYQFEFSKEDLVYMYKIGEELTILNKSKLDDINIKGGSLIFNTSKEKEETWKLELIPSCLFCKGSYKTTILVKYVNGKYIATCENCGTSTGECMSRREAIYMFLRPYELRRDIERRNTKMYIDQFVSIDTELKSLKNKERNEIYKSEYRKYYGEEYNEKTNSCRCQG